MCKGKNALEKIDLRGQILSLGVTSVGTQKDIKPLGVQL